ncbi:hypothetical protein [Kocuria tytonis]|uniref:PqqD family protein n=1 Tax=Kocuria tytonis TaxID=2054280 RepID=A0A495A3Y6_9MICC|nr:hypothetical protein [Kocuria tytonis]RKQ34181.1 hypothetical protein C1C97_010110 [Kocuria tytonis]
MRPGRLPGTVAPRWRDSALENPEDPSQLLVLLPERLVVLAGVAPMLWHACRERAPLTARALSRLLVDECGENPDAERLTRESVAHLLSLGVLSPAPDATGTPEG